MKFLKMPLLNMKLFKMKIKLNLLHLLLIILCVLVLARVGFSVKEYFQDGSSTPGDNPTYDPTQYNNVEFDPSKYDPEEFKYKDGEVPFQNDDNTLASYNSQSSSSSDASTSDASTTSTASSALPKGIPKSQIPEGDEDLYIKKTEIVPPVCPKCPDLSITAETAKAAKCPPCPACARCPESAFECKKVPNYNVSNDYNTIPKPVLANFSQFGM